jgi:hypothetical protein
VPQEFLGTHELTFPSRVPSSLAKAGSQWYGDRTSTNPEIDTNTCSKDDLVGLQRSVMGGQ